MNVDFSQLDAVVDRVGDAPVAYGLRFRRAKPFTTLYFERGDDASVHLYICVDEGYSPLSMALVHPPAPCVQYREVPRGGERGLVADLHAMLYRLAAREKVQSARRDGPSPAPPTVGLVLPFRLGSDSEWKPATGSVSR